MATPAETAPTRTIRSRRALPGSRALAGGFLVAVASIGTYASWSGAGEVRTDPVVVAAADLRVGHLVGPADLEVAGAALPSSLAERVFARPDAVVGQVVVAPLARGELVQRSAVVVPEEAVPARQVSFAIDAADALAGTLEAGELVDVLVTYGDGADASTEVVAVGARIARAPSGDGATTAVLLVSLPADADVLAVTNALRRGDVTIVRTTGVSGPPLRPGARSGSGP